jgi:hypothetical protein
MTNATETSFDFEALAVQIDFIGEMPSPWSEDKPRTVDAWKVTIGKEWGNKAGKWVTTYYTGPGLRNKRTGRPVRPTVANVLHSLFMDASAADESFSDWCDNLGYSDDSIKALNTYKACCDIAKHLRQQFDPETRAKIQAAIQEM